MSPIQMTGIYKLQTINGILELGRSRYRYTADVGFNVDVVWHQKPNLEPEPVKVRVPTTQPNQDICTEQADRSSKWDQTVAQEGFVMAFVTITLYSAYRAVEVWATKGLKPIIIPPFIHKIDRHNDNRNA